MARNTIIFDIDGTLADCGDRLGFIRPLVAPNEAESYGTDEFRCFGCRSGVGYEHDGRCPMVQRDWGAFFDPARVALDKPIGPMCTIARHLFHVWPGETIFLTGRPERLRQVTHTWLQHHVHLKIRSAQLYMRPDDDHRTDVDIKREFGERLGFKKIATVFEDRARVVQMWRENGVICLQPREGAY